MANMTNTNTLESRVFWDAAFKHLKKRDKRLSAILTRESYRQVKLDKDYYGALVESIVFQQIAGKAAEAILKRFRGLYGGRLPKPGEFLKTEEKLVKGAGISPQKYSYIKDLCERLDNGMTELEALEEMEDERVIEELDKIRGIGRWTAEMFLIFSLGREDVMPADDLGIRKAVQKLYGLRSLPSREKIAMLSRPWHPYCTVATLCLWRSLDTVAVEKRR